MKPSIPLLAFAVITASAVTLSAADTFIYFGSHSTGPNAGFSLAHFDTDTGALSKPEFLLEARAPAFFLITADGQHLYSCNSGTPGGVSAYSIDPHTGHLSYLNHELAGGGDTSFVSLDKTGHYLLAANYDGGNVAAFALKPDHTIGDWTAFIQHTGHSVNPQRQTHAYAHSIITDPTNRFALVADLGVDKLFVYRFDAHDGSLKPNKPGYVDVTAGSGPRHVRFHPSGRWVYLINEIASTVTGFTWDSERGTLNEFQTVSTLSADFKGANACAELEIHPNGKFLYGSNRGDDSLAVLSIDPTNGHLSLVQRISSGGKTPRNFAFDPTSRWIVCTNHGSNNAVVFSVNPDTGYLAQVGEPVSVPSPFCERFLPVR